MGDTILKEPGSETAESEEAERETPASSKAPTPEQLKEEGWSASEIEAAQKRGLIPKPAEKKEPAKEPEKEPAKTEAEQEPAAEEAEPEKEPEKKEPEAKPRAGGLPEFNLTPEQEAEFERIFGKGTSARGLYFRMRNERTARQRLESEVAALKAQISGKKSAAEPTAEEEEDLDKPVTARMLLDLRKKEAEEAEQQQQAIAERAQVVKAAQTEQEEYAQSIYVDWKPTMVLAVELLKDIPALVPEKHKQIRLTRLIRDMQIAASRADELGLDDDHAAFIAYEIGRMHPNYGKAAPAAEPKKDGPSKDNPKAPGAIKPETLKRIEQQTQRRGSSASVPAGGGKRVIDAEDVTADEFAGWDYKQRRAFREKHPEQYGKLMRG